MSRRTASRLVLPAPDEVVVLERPAVWVDLAEPVRVELADEGGEVVVFEVQGEEVLGEVLGVMHLA